jgi:hypothetical protein
MQYKTYKSRCRWKLGILSNVTQWWQHLICSITPAKEREIKKKNRVGVWKPVNSPGDHWRKGPEWSRGWIHPSRGSQYKKKEKRGKKCKPKDKFLAKFSRSSPEALTKWVFPTRVPERVGNLLKCVAPITAASLPSVWYTDLFRQTPGSHYHIVSGVRSHLSLSGLGSTKKFAD